MAALAASVVRYAIRPRAIVALTALTTVSFIRQGYTIVRRVAVMVVRLATRMRIRFVTAKDTPAIENLSYWIA